MLDQIRCLFREEIAGVLGQVNGLAARTAKVEEVAADHEGRLAALERIVKSPTASGASSHAGYTPSGGSGENEADFQPRSIYLNGWCTWDEKETKGVRRREEVQPWMVQLRSHLDPEDSEAIGEPQLFGVRNIKVQLPIRGNRAVELRGIVSDVIGAHNLLLGGALPKVFLEDSPGKTRVKRCMGKLMGTIKNMVATGETASPTWNPPGVRVSQANGAETVVAEINEYSGRPVFFLESAMRSSGRPQTT